MIYRVYVFKDILPPISKYFCLTKVFIAFLFFFQFKDKSGKEERCRRNKKEVCIICESLFFDRRKEGTVPFYHACLIIKENSLFKKK